MGLLNKSPLDLIRKVTDFSQTSAENTLSTIKEVHQKLAETSLDVAQEFGLPEDRSTELKEKHQRVLDHLHEGVCDAIGEVNQYIVKQAQAVDELADYSPKSGEPKLIPLDRKPSDKPQKKKTG